MKMRMIAGMLLMAVLSFGANQKAAAQGRLSVGLSIGGGYGGGYASYGGGGYCPPPPPPPPPPVYAAPVYYAPAYSYNNYRGYRRGYNRGYCAPRARVCAPRRSYGGYCR
jgi:hypothetical protein